MSWTLQIPRKKQPPGPNTALSLAGRMLPYLLLAFGCVLVWMPVYSIPKMGFALAGVAAGALVCCVALAWRRGRWPVLGIAGGLWLAGVLALGQTIAMGGQFAAELVYSRLSELFQSLYTTSPPVGFAEEQAFGIFLFFAGCLLAFLLAASALWLRSFWLSFVLCLPFFWYGFAKEGLPTPLAVVLLFSGWCALLLQGFSRRSQPASSARASLVAAGLCAALLTSLLLIFPSASYVASPTALQAGQRLEDFFAGFDLEKGLGNFGVTSRLGARSSARVNLSATGNLETGEGNVAAVRGVLNNVHYLRGFSCDEYDGQSWRLGAGARYDGGPDFAPLSYPFFGEMTLHTPTGTVETRESQQRRLRVRPHEHRPYSLAPYQARNAEDASLRFEGDAYLRDAGTQEDGTYSVAFNAAFDPAWLLNARDAPQPGDLALNAEPYNRDYMNHCMAQYTQLPGDVAQTLRQLAQEAGLAASRGEDDWFITARRVASYIRGVGSYTRSPGVQPAGEDFVLFFLTQSRQGYCVHYASAATAMLRALGVPARYVEGFVMPQRTGSDWIEVPNKNAHAWAEIWLPNIGWTPLEATPGGADALRSEDESESAPFSAPASSTSSLSSAPASSAASSAPSSAPSSAASGPAAGAATAPPTAAQRLLWGLGGGALLLGGTAAAYATVHRRRKKRFAQRSNNQAALALYAYLEKLRPFGKKPSAKATALAGKARFSQHTLTDEERRQLAEEVRTARAELLAQLPFARKLWFWLRGL